jgi:hypothetical protein
MVFSSARFSNGCLESVPGIYALQAGLAIAVTVLNHENYDNSLGALENRSSPPHLTSN